MNPIDLQRFCTTNTCRPNLLRPWTYDGHTYATDARICVRVPLLPLNPLSPDQPTPPQAISAAKCFAPLAELLTHPATPIPLPLPEPIFEKCAACDGQGHLAPCPDCKGEGVHTCSECEHERDCRECDARGLVPDSCGTTDCDACQSTGKINRPIRVVVGSAGYQARYLALIASLPEYQFYPNGNYGMAGFTFACGGGLYGSGVLMPFAQR
jgi:hypothetical protein